MGDDGGDGNDDLTGEGTAVGVGTGVGQDDRPGVARPGHEGEVGDLVAPAHVVGGAGRGQAGVLAGAGVLIVQLALAGGGQGGKLHRAQGIAAAAEVFGVKVYRVGLGAVPHGDRRAGPLHLDLNGALEGASVTLGGGGVFDVHRAGVGAGGDEGHPVQAGGGDGGVFAGDLAALAAAGAVVLIQVAPAGGGDGELDRFDLLAGLVQGNLIEVIPVKDGGGVIVGVVADGGVPIAAAGGLDHDNAVEGGAGTAGAGGVAHKGNLYCTAEVADRPEGQIADAVGA